MVSFKLRPDSRQEKSPIRSEQKARWGGHDGVEKKVPCHCRELGLPNLVPQL